MPPAHRLAAALALAGVLSAPARARGAGGCPIRLVPEGAPAEWRDAVAGAANRLSTLGPTHDCRAVEVVVGPEGGATLAFVTTDGRGAARALEGPADLAPTLEALLVTRPAPPSPPTDSPLPPAPPPPPPRPEIHLLVGAVAGGRIVGVPSGAATPVLGLRASVTLDRWELGLSADLAPYHRLFAGGAPEGFGLRGFAVGLTVGRREPLGAVALAYGLSLAVQSLGEEATDIPAVTTSRSLDVALPRVGAQARLVYPQKARARFVTDLGLDAAIGNLRLKSTEARQLPALPRLGASLAVGVEVAVL